MSDAERAPSIFTAAPDNSALAWNYLAELRMNWREVERALTRTAATMVLLALAYELLALKAAGEVTVAFIKVTSLEPIQQFIPVVVAYFFYVFMQLFAQSQNLWTTHDRLMKQVWPELSAQDLELPLQPSNSLFAAVTQVEQATKRQSERIARVMLVAMAARPLTLLVAPLVFLIYAYVVLIMDDDTSLVMDLVSLAASALFCSLAIAVFVGAASITGNR